MWVGIQIAAYTVLVLGHLALLFMAARHRVERGRAQRLLETALLVAALWALALGLLAVLAPGGWWNYVGQRAAQFGLIGLALLSAQFAEAFVKRSLHLRRWLGVVIVLCVAAIALDTVPLPRPVVVSFAPSFRLGSIELATVLLVIAWLLSVGAAWWISIASIRRATGSKHRNRIRYLLAALLGFTIGDILILFGGVPGVCAGLTARLLGFGLVTFAISRYDLPDIRRATLATVRFVLLIGLTALIYLVALVIVLLTSGTISSAPNLAVTAAFVAIALLIAAVADVFLGPRLHRWLDRTIMGQDYDLQRALRTYSRKVGLILDPERLADTTLNWLRTTMRVQWSAFLLLTPQAGDRVEVGILRATTNLSPESKSFARNSRFIVHFYDHGRPLSQYELDMLSWFQAMPTDERQWLQSLAPDLYIPVLVGDKPVALLALGPKAGGQPYSVDDLETLSILAGQTATALENARLMADLRAVQDDLHRLNSELAETNRQLARLDQAKTDFVTIASHELRTPLTQIFGYSDILAGLDVDDLSDTHVVHEFVQGISRGASRLKQVVDAMVDVSLIETGTLKIHPAVVPLEAVVENAIEAVRPIVRERGLSVTVRDLSDLPLIQADGARLEQAFVSLLSNAVKFTPDGGAIVVSGQLASSSPDGVCVEVLVADTGIGIDPDQQSLIFEKFYRAEETLLHSTDAVRFKGAGPGLGLVIAKGIVDAHGGRIWVESPGCDEDACPGSTFHVRLPITGAARG